MRYDAIRYGPNANGNVDGKNTKRSLQLYGAYSTIDTMPHDSRTGSICRTVSQRNYEYTTSTRQNYALSPFVPRTTRSREKQSNTKNSTTLAFFLSNEQIARRKSLSISIC